MRFLITIVLIALLLVQVASGAFAFQPNERTNKTHVLQLGTIGSFGLNETQNHILSLARYAAWCVNNQFTILPDVEIQLIVRNCGTGSGNPPQCLLHATNLVQDRNYSLSGFLTGAYTNDQRLLQYVAAAFNLPHVCGVASGNLLSNKHDYPTFMRTSVPDSLLDFVVVDIMVQYGWYDGIVALEDGDWGAGNRDALQLYATEKGVTLTFILCPTGAMSFATQVAQMKNLDVRIFISILNLREHWIFMNDLNNAGLIGPNYVMLLGASATLGIHPDNIAYAQAIVPQGVNVTQLRALQDGSIGFLPHGGSGSYYETVKEVWETDFAKYWFPGTRPLLAYYWYFYDAVLAYAVAVDNLMKAGTAFSAITPTVLQEALLKTTFNGTTGYVAFDVNGDNTYGLFDVSIVTPTDSYIAKIYEPLTKSYTDVGPIVFFGGIPCNCVHGKCVSRICNCDEGYTGIDCSEKRSEGLSTTIIIIVIVVSVAVLVAVGVVFYVFYQRRHSTLIKEIANRQQSDIPRKIGQGAAGEVYTATFRGTEIAVKLIMAKNMDSSMMQEFKLESAIMCALRHPNIVLFMGSCYDQKKNEMLLLMEHMARGSLHGVLHNYEIPVTYNLQVHLAAQGINFLHQCNPAIIHCDIKSHNVLLDNKWNARISDFGITKLAKFQQDSNGKHEALGTIYWAAPEILNNRPHTPKSDCYAFGVVLWEIFHRRDPYQGRDPLSVAVDVISNGARPEIDPSVPSEISTLIRKCWATAPEQRPTMEEMSNELRKLLSGDDDIVPALPRNIRVSAPTGSVFLIATEVVGANLLWDTYPLAMRDSMLMHNECARSLLKKLRGYEISFTKDKSFLVAFAGLEEAIEWATSVQSQLIHLDWPEEISQAPCAGLELSQNGKPIWRGLRVRMGLHKGMPKIEREDYTDKILYDGPVIKKTWQLLDHSTEGMIVMSPQVQELIEKLPQENKGEYSWAGYVHVLDPEIQKHEPTYLFNTTALFSNRSKTSSPVSSPGDLLFTAVDMESEGTALVPTSYPLPWDLQFSDLRAKENIGKSFVADVKKATYNGIDVVMKVLHNQNLHEKDIFELKYLASTLHKIKHPNLINLIGITTKPNVSIVYEYMPMGTLQSMLHSNVQLTFAEKIRIARDIASGMYELSQHPDPKIQVHRNLKSSRRNREVKVTDFALNELYDVMKTLTSVGMAAWMAPELLSGEATHSQATTVYAFGMLLWEIYVRRVPYEKIHPIKLVTEILGGHRPEIPNDCPSDYKEVMTSCWNVNPNLRPSWKELINSFRVMNI